jgi:hypothetical protein
MQHASAIAGRAQAVPGWTALGPLGRLGEWLVGFPDNPARRALHRAPVALWRLGVGGLIGRPLVLVTTRGPEGGKLHRTLLRPHWLGDRLYLWCPYRDPSQWYRNVLAFPLVTVQSADGVRAAQAVRLANQVEAAGVYGMLKGNDFDADLLHRYLESIGIADTVSSAVANRQRLHVFRCDPLPDLTLPPQGADLLWVWPLAAGLGGLVALALVRRRHPGRALL